MRCLFSSLVFLRCRVVRTKPALHKLSFIGPKLCPWRHYSASVSGFLQILPRDWRPVPATEPAVDFLYQVISHAGRTIAGAEFKFELSPRCNH